MKYVWGEEGGVKDRSRETIKEISSNQGKSNKNLNTHIENLLCTKPVT